jgi:maltooligosyltrehalose trehalohydrolase
MAALALRQLGVVSDGRATTALLWAPRAKRVALRLAAANQDVPLEPRDRGYFETTLEARPGTRYQFILDGTISRPDPASRFQPEGVHGPSQIVTSAFDWTGNAWRGMPFERYTIYELHVGTFTRAGTFEGVIEYLGYLRDLGITAIELMPIGQFPGGRNWGYDGVFAFAAQNTYGGADGLRRLVDTAHTKGLAVILDVVYNHVGPEGNCLGDFGPYFTDRYTTPWGPALNFDGPDSDEVRRYFIENALYWVTDCRIDALRVDAVHAISDASPRTFVDELISAVHERGTALNRSIHVICESASNDARLLRPRELGGLAADAQWNDDFHHALRTLLTPERSGYYQSYGQISHLARAYSDGFVYQGEYSPFHRRQHGTASRGIPPARFVVFSQNHDQVGNRAIGDRLSTAAPLEALKLAAAAVILSPFIPLLFMGEEHGETAPFQYFVSHTKEAVIEAVRNGRKAEFASFGWSAPPPDPQDPAVFANSRLRREGMDYPPHSTLLEFYHALFRLRSILGLPAFAPSYVEHDDTERTVIVRHTVAGREAALVLHFSAAPARVSLPLPAGHWRVELDSSHGRWGGPGALLPEIVTSGGHASVELGGFSAALLLRVATETTRGER